MLHMIIQTSISVGNNRLGKRSFFSNHFPRTLIGRGLLRYYHKAYSTLMVSVKGLAISKSLQLHMMYKCQQENNNLLSSAINLLANFCCFDSSYWHFSSILFSQLFVSLFVSCLLSNVYVADASAWANNNLGNRYFNRRGLTIPWYRRDLSEFNYFLFDWLKRTFMIDTYF